MTPDARRRYARHLLLAEIGERGQQRLAAATVAMGPETDPRVHEVASIYLVRAGLTVVPGTRSLGSSDAVDALAARPELRAAAAACLGALAAVEAIKTALGVGTPGALPPGLALADG